MTGIAVLEIFADFSDTPKEIQKVTESFRDFWRSLETQKQRETHTHTHTHTHIHTHTHTHTHTQGLKIAAFWLCRARSVFVW